MLEEVLMPGELDQIFNRLSAVESAQKDASKIASDTNLEVQKDLVRLDEGLKGVREQARAHQDANLKAQRAIQEQMDFRFKALENMITNNVKELYDGIDKIVSALGIADSVDSASTLRDNLKTLNDMLSTRKQDIQWIRRGVITISITGVGTIIVLGLKTFFG